MPYYRTTLLQYFDMSPTDVASSRFAGYDEYRSLIEEGIDSLTLVY
jgi:hypothetical protein